MKSLIRDSLKEMRQLRTRLENDGSSGLNIQQKSAHPYLSNVET